MAPIRILGEGLPIAGYAKIGMSGGKKPDGKQAPPKKFDHIEITTRERDAQGVLCPDVALMHRLIKDIGVNTCGGCQRSEELSRKYDIPEFKEVGLPIQVPIILPYDRVDLNLDDQLAWFRGRTIFCKGDGETAMRRAVTGTKNGHDQLGDFQPHEPCGNACPAFNQSRGCKPSARLRFMLQCQQTVGQVYEFQTTSWNSLRNIRGAIQEIATQTGLVKWLPLIFEVSPQTVAFEGRSSTQMIARVYYPGGPDKLLETVETMLEKRAPLIESVRMLEARVKRSFDWSPEEIEAHVREFTPEITDDVVIDTTTTAAAPDVTASPGVGDGDTSDHPDTEPGPVAAPQSSDPPENGFSPPVPQGAAPAGDSDFPSNPPTDSDPASPPEAAPPITPEQKTELWQTVKQHTESLVGRSPSNTECHQVLRATLAAHDKRKSDEVSQAEFDGVLETVGTVTL